MRFFTLLALGAASAAAEIVDTENEDDLQFLRILSSNNTNTTSTQAATSGDTTAAVTTVADQGNGTTAAPTTLAETLCPNCTAGPTDAPKDAPTKAPGSSGGGETTGTVPPSDSSKPAPSGEKVSLGGGLTMQMGTSAEAVKLQKGLEELFAGNATVTPAEMVAKLGETAKGIMDALGASATDAQKKLAAKAIADSLEMMTRTLTASIARNAATAPPDDTVKGDKELATTASVEMAEVAADMQEPVGLVLDTANNDNNIDLQLSGLAAEYAALSTRRRARRSLRRLVTKDFGGGFRKMRASAEQQNLPFRIKRHLYSAYVMFHVGGQDLVDAMNEVRQGAESAPLRMLGNHTTGACDKKCQVEGLIKSMDGYRCDSTAMSRPSDPACEYINGNGDCKTVFGAASGGTQQVTTTCTQKGLSDDAVATAQAASTAAITSLGAENVQLMQAAAVSDALNNPVAYGLPATIADTLGNVTSDLMSAKGKGVTAGDGAPGAGASSSGAVQTASVGLGLLVAALFF